MGKAIRTSFFGGGGIEAFIHKNNIYVKMILFCVYLIKNTKPKSLKKTMNRT